MKKLLSGLALAAAIISSSACAPAPVHVFMQDRLPVPDSPALPRIAAGSLECLSDQAYVSLVARDVMQAEHIKRLEAIIRTTWDK